MLPYANNSSVCDFSSPPHIGSFPLITSWLIDIPYKMIMTPQTERSTQNISWLTAG